MPTPNTATIAELEAHIAALSEQNRTFFAAGKQNTKAHYEINFIVYEIAEALLLARRALHAVKKAMASAQED